MKLIIVTLALWFVVGLLTFKALEDLDRQIKYSQV